MGRNTDPRILRVGNILRSWDGKWFSDKASDFQHKLLDDLKIRRYLDKTLRSASISKVEIVRQPQEIVLTIHTSRPAVVIGRGGSGIEKIQQDLKGIIGPKQRVRINVQEIRNPDTDAVAVATQVVDQLERRMPFRRVLKQSVQRSIQAGAKGIRVAVAGRLNGAEISRVEWLAEGNVPLHTFRSDISFAKRTAFTTFGTIGVKVWINRGELVVDQEEEKPGETAYKEKAIKATHRRSLSEKVETAAPKKSKASPKKK